MKKIGKREFWRIIKLFDWDTEEDDDSILAPATNYLATLSDEEIFSFEDLMSQYLYDIDGMKYAKYVYGSDVNSYISADEFLYIRCVAVANGKGYYDSILFGGRKLDPDLEFEALLYLPQNAWALKHGKDASEYPHIPEPSYETFSNKELWN